MVGARARGIYNREAKERQHIGKGDDGSGGRGNKKNLTALVPEGFKGESREFAGKAVGVGGRSIDFATKVLNQGETMAACSDFQAGT